ncbi:MAG: AraC family transcriptional regulator [Bacteroidetes bacterium]|nr:AraC family transcriptional regulator [Bacteroidota bacterium]
MKPILRKIDTGTNYSFSIREDIFPFLYNHWHYHPEAELTVIRKGKGTRLVGDSMERFADGDLILLGANIPHLWRGDDIYFKKTPGLRMEAIAIHFTEECFGQQFLSLPELKSVKELLIKARKGLKITGATKQLIIEKMERIVKAKEVIRITLLLEMLYIIASSKNYRLLASSGFTKSYDVSNTDRINEIYTYTFNNFQEKISIKKIASVASISQHSFCRYFKKRTLKTYWQFLQEVRLGYACKLLIENDMSIAQVCYESGFNNLSNFNRYFKALIKKTPLQYGKEFGRKNHG